MERRTLNKDKAKYEYRDVILHNAAKCKKCNDKIESTHVHDFVTCKCGAISVDGGRDYLRRVGDLDSIKEMSKTKKVRVVVEEKPFFAVKRRGDESISLWADLIKLTHELQKQKIIKNKNSKERRDVLKRSGHKKPKAK
jgi:hypothetical protein